MKVYFVRAYFVRKQQNTGTSTCRRIFIYTCCYHSVITPPVSFRPSDTSMQTIITIRVFLTRCYITPWLLQKTNQFIRRRHPHAGESASKAVLTSSRTPLTLHATRPTPCGASRSVQAMSAWSAKTRCAPSRHCRDATVYGHTTTAMHHNEYTPPPPVSINWTLSSMCKKICLASGS